MAAVDVPLVNGVYYAYADIIFRVGPGQFYGCSSINYTDKLARQYVRGTSREPLGMTSGQYEASCDFEMFLPAANAFMQFLSTITPGLGMSAASLTITVSYQGAPEGAPLPTITDVIEGAHITDIESPQSEGLDAIKRKFTCMAQRITRNKTNLVQPLNGIGVIG